MTFSKPDVVWLLLCGLIAAVPWLRRYLRWALAERRTPYPESVYESPVNEDGTLTRTELATRIVSGVGAVVVIVGGFWFGR